MKVTTKLVKMKNGNFLATCLLCGKVKEVHADIIKKDGEYYCEQCKKYEYYDI